MLEEFFNAVKRFFGYNVERSVPQKRHLEVIKDEFDCDISTDEEFEYETPSKKRRLVNIRSLDSDIMAEWIHRRRGFADMYYFSKPSEILPRKKFENRKTSQFLIPKDSHKSDLTSSKSDRTVFHSTGKLNSFTTSTTKTTKSIPLIELDSSDNVLNGDSAFSQEIRKPNKVPPKKSYNEKPILGPTRNNTTSLHSKSRVNGTNFSVKSPGTCDHECQIHRKLADNSSARLTVNQCIQLEEKEKYRQLLNRYTTPVSFSSPIILPITEKENSSSKSSSQRSSVSKRRLNYSEYKQQKEKIFQASLKSSRGKKPVDPSPTNDGDSSEISIISQNVSDEPIITKIISPVRKRMLTSDCVEFPYNEKWLADWRRRLTADRQEKSRLIEEAEKRVKKPPWSKTLDALQENIREQLSIAEKEAEIIEEIFLVKDTSREEIEEDVEPMPELTAEMEEKIDDALRPHPPDEVLVEAFRLQIRRRDMETLQDLNWLNDEVINFYMNLLMERGKLKNMPSVYACNTFFYPKLVNSGHAALSRWTRKIDIFSHDIMLVPVHLGVHWCLAVVDFRKKVIKYYDSMGGKNNECLNALCNYLQAESLDKKKKPFDMKDWALENVKDAPQQMNSSDCGMFACKYAEYITRNAKITFKQNHMPYFRRRMVYEILTARLL